jgi:hypothetical protein
VGHSKSNSGGGTSLADKNISEFTTSRAYACLINITGGKSWSLLRKQAGDDPLTHLLDL